MDRLEQTIAKAEAFLSNVSDGTAITVNDIRDVIDYLYELKNFKDASEKGLLWQFPCKPGDILYNVDTDEYADGDKMVIPFEIDRIEICNDGKVLFLTAHNDVICDLECLTEGKLHMERDRIFVKREDAKAFLEELLRDNGERI